MTLAEFLAPMSLEVFKAQYEGRNPIHIPGAAAKAKAVLDWASFNEIMGIESHWTGSNLRLALNSHPIYPEHFTEESIGVNGPTNRASPSKIALFASMGASIVANDVQDISTAVRSISNMLGEAFSAKSNANAYCSFHNIQAFGAHYDLHEVFAIQCEGEKIWRLYENRENNPVDPPALDDLSRQRMDREKGLLMSEITLKPGDILYIPRGWYHDAIASSEASLHVTFSVTPLNGRDALSALISQISDTHQIRSYIPDHRLEGGKVLRNHLSYISSQLAELCCSQSFFNELVVLQKKTHKPNYVQILPTRSELHWYRATGRTGTIQTDLDGSYIVTEGCRTDIGIFRDPASYILSRPAISIEEIAAKYPHFKTDEVESLVDIFVRRGLLVPYTPELGG